MPLAQAAADRSSRVPGMDGGRSSAPLEVPKLTSALKCEPTGVSSLSVLFLKLLIAASIGLRVSIVVGPCPAATLLSVPIAVVAEILPPVFLVVPVALLALIPVATENLVQGDGVR